LSEIDGVVIAPIFRDETIAFTNMLSEQHIPFSFIDSMIEEVPFLTYYGQNSFQSGYVAAKLLLSSMQENSRIIVVRTKRKGSSSNQTKGRINGFMEYIARHNLNNISLINIELKDNDDSYNRNLLQSIFQENNNIKALITFNSKIYKLIQYMDGIEIPDIRIIGYDLLQKNIQFLKEGKISYLIGQRPEKQAYTTIKDMCNAVILKQETKKTTYVPIDILMKENIEDYLNFEQ
jgi:LacI family transcriptional regulator